MNDIRTVIAALLLLCSIASAGETGRLLLDSKPSGAQVKLGETTVGVTPVVVRLPIGKHALRFSLEGYEARVVEVDVVEGVSKIAPVELEIATHLLSLLGDPEWDGFNVLIDGLPALDLQGRLALTPCSVRVLRGKTRVGLCKRGFKDRVETVVVTGDVDVVLKKKPTKGRSYVAPKLARWAHCGRWTKQDTGSVFEFRPDGTIDKVGGGGVARDDHGRWIRVGRSIVIEMHATGRMTLREEGGKLLGPNEPMCRWTLERVR